MGFDFGTSALNGLSGGFYGITNPGGGNKSKVPALPPIDIDAEQLAAISGNSKALDATMGIASRTNAFNAAELQKMYASALPGYEAIKANVGKNIQSMTSGEIPTDVSNNVLRSAAARAYQGGFSNSGMGRNLAARDLGLTSLDLMNKGQDSATRWLETSKTPTFDVTSMFISPLDRLSFKAAERNIKFDRDWMSQQISALGSQETQMLRNMISNY